MWKETCHRVHNLESGISNGHLSKAFRKKNSDRQEFSACTNIRKKILPASNVVCKRKAFLQQ
jgi:hypothetical protein